MKFYDQPAGTAVRIPPSLRIVALVLLALAISTLWGGIGHANRSGAEIVGVIRVIDGDSFEVAGVKIRLHAIDAPETGQICQTTEGADWACGGWITRAVADRYAGKEAQCQAVDTDRYGRTVAKCTALGEDVGGWLVREGYAFAYAKYGDDYVDVERQAAASNQGLHAVRLQSPAAYRASRRTVADAPQSGCKIKGNISADGTRIYHTPGQSFYDRTAIDTARGERWFCSPTQAQAAGWRAARR